MKAKKISAEELHSWFDQIKKDQPDLNEITKILQNHPAIINSKDLENGNTALHFAVTKNKELVKLLLEKGADIEIKNHIFLSPLKLVQNAIEQELQSDSNSIANSPSTFTYAIYTSEGFEINNEPPTTKEPNETAQILKLLNDAIQEQTYDEFIYNVTTIGAGPPVCVIL